VFLGNPNAGIIMIGEKAADLIKEDHLNGKRAEQFRPMSHGYDFGMSKDYTGVNDVLNSK